MRGYSHRSATAPQQEETPSPPAAVVKKRAVDLNKDYHHLDWEIEDLVAPQIFEAFETDHSHEITRSKAVAGKTHRDLTWAGKFKLRQYVQDYADLEDLVEFVVLIRALRNYLRLKIEHLPLPEARR